MTKSTPTGTTQKSNPTAAGNTLNDPGRNAPWSRPELEKNPDQVLEALRETKHMINSLQKREARLKAEIDQLHRDQRLSAFADPEDPRKFNHNGISVSICKGRKKRIYDSAVQMQIEVKEKEIDRIKYIADHKNQFTDEFAPDYWRVNLAKDEVL